jgi:hypothetical protein
MNTLPNGQIARRLAAAWTGAFFFCVAAFGAEPAMVKQATGSIIRTKGKIQTGSSSNIELELPSLAVARIGSFASFRFSADYRNMALDSGTMLFAQPRAAGTTTIHASGIVTEMAGRAALELANVRGQVKVVALDGKVVAQFVAKPAERARLRAGQMVAIPAGATSMPAAAPFKLATLLKTSVLFNMGPFPGQRAIRQNATKQTGAPVLPGFTGGFDPDSVAGGASALTTLWPAGTAAGVARIEAAGPTGPGPVLTPGQIPTQAQAEILAARGLPIPNVSDADARRILRGETVRPEPIPPPPPQPVATPAPRPTRPPVIRPPIVIPRPTPRPPIAVP